MIQTLEIYNFKSIRRLTLECRRVNVFVGKPGTGKSNILESLGVFSVPFTGDLGDFVRLREIKDLFYRQNMQEEIIIEAGKNSFNLRFDNQEKRVLGTMSLKPSPSREDKTQPDSITIGFSDLRADQVSHVSPFRFYRFSPETRFQPMSLPFLAPPRGENLTFLVQSNQELRESLDDLLAPYQLKLWTGHQENNLMIQQETGKTVVTFPFSMISSTLRHMIFYLTAMETNENAILIFEEPQHPVFPLYIVYFGERIARDRSNQYFLSVHSHYLFFTILEKTPVDDLAIFVTHLQGNQTTVRTIAGRKELEELLDLTDIAQIYDMR